MRLIFAAVVTCLAIPVQAQVILPGQCYLREYSRDHLARHPDQTVTRIALGPDIPGTEPILRVAVTVRGDREVYGGVAYCDRWGKRMQCEMEGDAGAFTLEAARNGAVSLTLAPRGIVFEGTREFVTLEGDRGDDRVFLIPPVPADACP